MLQSLVRLIPKVDTGPEAEDIFTSALGLIFTDDAQNFFGDEKTIVAYRSRKFDRELLLVTADTHGEEERRKFAHYVWNASLLLAELHGGKPDALVWKEHGNEALKPHEWWLSEDEQKTWNIVGKTVLELGAGAGLAGMICALAGAEQVVLSDFPAAAFIEALKLNLTSNLPEQRRNEICSVQGHLWGRFDTEFAKTNREQFDCILAADCLWMAHEHMNLLASMAHFLTSKDSARIYVVAGFHTGRGTVASFFDAVKKSTVFRVDSLWEANVEGARRAWDADREEENSGERKKWLVVAVLRRTG